MDDPSPTRTGQIQFYYQKSRFFRVVHADGVIGNITPQGLLHLAVFSERTAIPQRLAHELNEDGSLSPPVEVDGKQGVVREIDFDMIMTKTVAIGLKNWLEEQIAEFDRLDAMKSKV